jgi:hypothetical protein
MWAMGHHVDETQVSKCIPSYQTILSPYVQDGLIVRNETIAAVPLATFTGNFEDIMESTSGIYPFARKYTICLIAVVIHRHCSISVLSVLR